jgi:hypothetical protein
MLSIEAVRAEAQNADQAQDWARSAEFYEQVVQGHSATFWDYYFYARAMLYSGRVREAAELIGHLPQDGWDEGAVLVIRATLAESMRNDMEAAQLWAEAFDAGANPYWTLFGRGRSLSRLGFLREAQAVMSRALTLPNVEEGGIRFALQIDLRLADYAAAEAKFQYLGDGLAERRDALLSSLPGMTWPKERLAVFNAAHNIQGEGQILDLGCFLGSLTLAMAMGLHENCGALNKGVRIYAFDQFVWDSSYMDTLWQENFPGEKLKTGDSFRHLFDYFTRERSNLIEVVAGDLLQLKWPSKQIELLSIDAMKTPDLSRHIVSEFFPSLIPGGSVFHQDFCFATTWWIHIFHYLMRDCLEVSDTLSGAAGIMFCVNSRVTQADVNRVLNHDLADRRTADESFAYSLSLAAPEDRKPIADGHIQYFMDTHRPQLAEEWRSRYSQI